jgi:putative peptide zinc metalloprotease protein
MFLVFFPVPYVDATASAALRSKYHRVAVGAAGIMVETFIASLAAIVWVLAEPGAVRSVAYNAMLLGGVSTVIFNANPLLRFDGYYVLSDLIEIPNLGPRANQWWGRLVERWVFRARDLEPHPARGGERAWLAAFAPAAFVYRLIVLLGIAIFVATEFFVIGVLVAIWGVTSSLFVPIGRAIANVAGNPRLAGTRGRGSVMLAGGASVFGGLLFAVPAPLHTVTEGVVWLPEDSFVRASTEGFVARMVATPGAWVATGAPLIQNEEPTLAAELRMSAARIEALSAKLNAEQFADRVQADLTRRELEAVRAGHLRDSERARLLLVSAGADGTFVVPRAGDLVGRFHRRGEIIGYVAKPVAKTVRLVVPQADIELVASRLRGAELRLAHRPEETITAAIVREVPAASDQLPSLAFTTEGGGTYAVDPRDRQGLKTLQRVFQYDVELPAGTATPVFGSRVHIRLDHGFEPLGWQAYRRIRQLFLARFDV